MEASIISSIITGFGPTGAFVGYMIWRDMRRDAIDRERIDADVGLASALATLKTVIDGLKS